MALSTATDESPSTVAGEAKEIASDAEKLSTLSYVKLALVAFIEACETFSGLMRTMSAATAAREKVADQMKPFPPPAGRK